MSSTSIPTFRELAEEVLRLRDEQGIRGITREHSRYRCHVATAAFVDKLVTEVTSPDIREWLRWMQQRDAVVHPNEAPRKLDRATINRAQSLVSAVFSEAVEREIVETNPCLGVKLKKRVTDADTVEKWAYLTPDEQRAILACDAVSKAEKLTIQFAIGTGLRQGEQFNLELADLHVDGDDPHVIVRYSNPHKGKKCPPKSGKKRKVPLMGATLEAAREWLAMLPTFAPSNPMGLVFPTERGCRRQQGKPLGRSRTIRSVYRAAGIKHRKGLHWHALRHTFATNLITGVLGRAWRIEEVQVVMGHSSVTITQRYAHLGEDAIAKAARETVIVEAPTMTTEAPLVVPEITPIERLMFGLAGAARSLAAKLKGASDAA